MVETRPIKILDVTLVNRSYPVMPPVLDGATYALLQKGMGGYDLSPSEVAQLKVDIEKSKNHWIVIDGQRFADRLPEAILKRVQSGTLLKALSQSSYSLQNEEVITDDDIPKKLAEVYGVGGSDPVSLTMSRFGHCESGYSPDYFWYITQKSEKKFDFYCTKTLPEDAVLGIPPNLGATKTFLDFNRTNLEQACQIIHLNHPKLNYGLIQTMMLYNILQEMAWYDETDIQQDLAATRFTGACEGQKFREVFNNGLMQWLASTCEGSYYCISSTVRTRFIKYKSIFKCTIK